MFSNRNNYKSFSSVLVSLIRIFRGLTPHFARVSGYASNKLHFVCPCKIHPALKIPRYGKYGHTSQPLIIGKKPRRR